MFECVQLYLQNPTICVALSFLYSEALQGAQTWEETLEDLVRESSQR